MDWPVDLQGARRHRFSPRVSTESAKRFSTARGHQFWGTAMDLVLIELGCLLAYVVLLAIDLRLPNGLGQ